MVWSHESQASREMSMPRCPHSIEGSDGICVLASCAPCIAAMTCTCLSLPFPPGMRPRIGVCVVWIWQSAHQLPHRLPPLHRRPAPSRSLNRSRRPPGLTPRTRERDGGASHPQVLRHCDVRNVKPWDRNVAWGLCAHASARRRTPVPHPPSLSSTIPLPHLPTPPAPPAGIPFNITTPHRRT